MHHRLPREIWILSNGGLPWRSDDDCAKAVYGIRLEPPGEWNDLLHDSAQHLLAQQKRFAKWLEGDDSLVVANAMIILCRRVINMLDHQMKRLGENFREAGGFRERMSAVRIESRNAQSDPEAPACPDCGKPMRKILAKRGQNAGNPFWSCSAYPECKGTRKWEG